MSPEQREQLREELFLLTKLLSFHNAYEDEIASTTMTPDEYVDYRVTIMAEIYRLQLLLDADKEP